MADPTTTILAPPSAYMTAAQQKAVQDAADGNTQVIAQNLATTPAIPGPGADYGPNSAVPPLYYMNPNSLGMDTGSSNPVTGNYGMTVAQPVVDPGATTVPVQSVQSQGAGTVPIGTSGPDTTAGSGAAAVSVGDTDPRLAPFVADRTKAQSEVDAATARQNAFQPTFNSDWGSALGAYPNRPGALPLPSYPEGNVGKAAIIGAIASALLNRVAPSVGARQEGNIESGSVETAKNLADSIYERQMQARNVAQSQQDARYGDSVNAYNAKEQLLEHQDIANQRGKVAEASIIDNGRQQASKDLQTADNNLQRMTSQLTREDMSRVNDLAAQGNQILTRIASGGISGVGLDGLAQQYAQVQKQLGDLTHGQIGDVNSLIGAGSTDARAQEIASGAQANSRSAMLLDRFHNTMQVHAFDQKSITGRLGMQIEAKMSDLDKADADKMAAIRLIQSGHERLAEMNNSSREQINSQRMQNELQITKARTDAALKLRQTLPPQDPTKNALSFLAKENAAALGAQQQIEKTQVDRMKYMKEVDDINDGIRMSGADDAAKEKRLSWLNDTIGKNTTDLATYKAIYSNHAGNVHDYAENLKGVLAPQAPPPRPVAQPVPQAGGTTINISAVPGGTVPIGTQGGSTKAIPPYLKPGPNGSLNFAP